MPVPRFEDEAMTAPAYTLHHGDALKVLQTLPSESVHVCVSSPPYYGLRDYGTATWDGGDPDCDHRVGRFERGGLSAKQASNSGSAGDEARGICPKCGARRVDQQIGLEDTPDAYVSRLVEVFREVRRVLHKTGVVFLNLGDSYNGSGGAGGDYSSGGLRDGQPKYPGRNVNGLGPKQLLGVPWRVAFALQADGWILRSEIIWHKKAPMPESVTDRPTKAHEQVFLLAKNAAYYYDAEAIAEYASQPIGSARLTGQHKVDANGFTTNGHGNSTLGANQGASTRNRRSVWTLGPEPYAEAHFATMPTKLVEPCILAGSSAHGCCSKCKAPWERVVERTPLRELAVGADNPTPKHKARQAMGLRSAKSGLFGSNSHNSSTPQSPIVKTLGWQPTCTCNADVIPCTALDPFSGSGTTLAVALKHGRSAIGIDLNASYITLAHDRIGRTQPMLLDIT